MVVPATTLTCRAPTNPNRMGLPKRPPSLAEMVDAYVAELGGDKPIHR